MLNRILSSKFTESQANLALLILRIGLGGMMLTHGYPKFQRMISGNWQFADPIGLGSEFSLVLAVLAEFFGSILILGGFATRIGALLGASTMFVAGFIHHADDPFGGKEKAFLYLTGYIVLLIVGGGKFSIESKLK